MSFCDQLNQYIDDLGCSAKDLASASGISPAAISRYRTGERTPDPDSKQMRMLAEGIAKLSSGRFSEDAVHNSLAIEISGIAVDYDTYLANLKSLLSALSTNNNELARALNFDPSYISRILGGQRRPADLQAFTQGVAQFATRKATSNGSFESLRTLIGSPWADAKSDKERAQAVSTWLETNYAPTHNPIGSFLEKLDTFNLNDFIRAIRFDEIKVPTTPIQLPTTKTYTGIHEMMDCELDFLKAAVLSKSSADVIMYSDMPIEEMAGDEDFSKKWMLGIAMLLKKGLRLRIVHDTNRPLFEMMIGLEGWIPMYMTGQIEPYYFNSAQNDVFCHLLKVAGSVAMQGEAIAGHQAEGRYTLTKNRDEVRYYRKRAERMIGCIPHDLLEQILRRNGLPTSEREAIAAFAQEQSDLFESALSQNEVRFELPSIGREEFEGHPASLGLSALFREEAIPYTYDEYAQHLEALREAVGRHENCSLVVDGSMPFRNMQITICKGKHVLVSKNADPVIHFIIEHPAMVAAFERFAAPITD
jgi:transcriptional regulator with XRE-family HTH domain